MKYIHAILGAVGMAALLAAGGSPALAAPAAAASAASAASPARRPRASIRLEVGRGPSWVGQAIPVVLKARFRDVEGVTLEGAPELTSAGVFTSDLAREPHQSTENVDGEPVLVATWTGTITPSTAGPLALSVELPARIRFHETTAQPAFQAPSEPDPFTGMDVDPSDPTSIQRMFQSFQQSFAQAFRGSLDSSLGPAHDDAVTLKASSPAIEVKPLPVVGQPAGFSGAVGRFDVQASVAEAPVRASEPLTLQIAVQGDGDLGRVDLPGVATSADWKAYPTTSKTDPPVPGKRSGRKIFEQVLIPLHGGRLTIPPVALAAFDPVSGRYATVASSPLTIAVEGALEPVASSEPATPVPPVPGVASPSPPSTNALAAPSPDSLLEAPQSLGLRLAPVLAALGIALGVRLGKRRGNEEKSLRRTMHRTARRGTAVAFFDAAHRLIVVHFAKRWGLAEGEVTADVLRQHLGPTAEPFVTAIAWGEALRFGRRDIGPTDLATVCSSIEESLRDAR